MRAGLRLLEHEEARLFEISAVLVEGLKQTLEGDLSDGDGRDAMRRAFAKARNAR